VTISAPEHKTPPVRSADGAQSMIMVDWAVTDPRSVSAQLRGHGDGRADRFERFRSRFLKRNPAADDAAVAAAYALACRGTDRAMRWLSVAVRLLIAMAMLAAAGLLAQQVVEGSLLAGLGGVALVLLGCRQVGHALRRWRAGSPTESTLIATVTSQSTPASPQADQLSIDSRPSATP
jgi:hypothetical protein